MWNLINGQASDQVFSDRLNNLSLSRISRFDRSTRLALELYGDMCICCIFNFLVIDLSNGPNSAPLSVIIFSNAPWRNISVRMALDTSRSDLFLSGSPSIKSVNKSFITTKYRNPLESGRP